MSAGQLTLKGVDAVYVVDVVRRGLEDTEVVEHVEHAEDEEEEPKDDNRVECAQSSVNVLTVVLDDRLSADEVWLGYISRSFCPLCSCA